MVRTYAYMCQWYKVIPGWPEALRLVRADLRKDFMKYIETDQSTPALMDYLDNYTAGSWAMTIMGQFKSLDVRMVGGLLAGQRRVLGVFDQLKFNDLAARVDCQWMPAFMAYVTTGYSSERFMIRYEKIPRWRKLVEEAFRRMDEATDITDR